MNIPTPSVWKDKDSSQRALLELVDGNVAYFRVMLKSGGWRSTTRAASLAEFQAKYEPDGWALLNR